MRFLRRSAPPAPEPTLPRCRHITEHAPSNRTDPTCTGCDGAPWPCTTAQGAMKYVDPRWN